MLKRLLVLMAAVLLHTVGTSGSASAASAGTEQRPSSQRSANPPRIIVGVMEDHFKVPDYAVAERNIKLAYEMGVRAIKVSVPWRKEQLALDDYNRAALCNSANITDKLSMKLSVVVIGDAGNMPFKQDQYDWFNTFLKDIMNVWKGFSCAPNTKLMTIQPWNEPNIPTFMKLQYRGKKRESAWSYAGMLNSAYKVIHQHAHELGVKADVWGLGVSTAHDPVNFIRAFGAATKHHKFLRKPMDTCTWHPYPENWDIGPRAKGRGFGSFTNIMKAVRQNIGDCPIVYSEAAGGETIIPAQHLWMYRDVDPSNLRLISEETQAKFVIDAVEVAAQQGVREIYFFHLFDECDRTPGWQTGFYYCLEPGHIIPKASVTPVSAFLKQVAEPLPESPPTDAGNPDPLE